MLCSILGGTPGDLKNDERWQSPRSRVKSKELTARDVEVNPALNAGEHARNSFVQLDLTSFLRIVVAGQKGRN